MLTEYLKLHDKFLKELEAYHNAHVDFVSQRPARRTKDSIKRILREMRRTARAIQIELLNLHKIRQEEVKDNYQTQRSKNNGNDKTN